MQRRTFIGGATAVLFLAACGKTRRLAPLTAGATVLAFGDSVTFGTGAAAGEDWPTLLAARTGWRVVNGGVPGDTAQAAKERIQPLLDEHRPALVIVEIGGNDFLRRRAMKQVQEDVRSIVQSAQRSGAQVVLIAVPELSLLGALTRKPSDAAIYRELGDEERVPVVDAVFADILSRPELCSDQIHPNARGYRQMADAIHAHLAELGLAPTSAS